MSSPGSSTRQSTDDSNRMVIIVTGANSGLGLGYCHRILRQLSLPPSTPTPDAFDLRPSSPYSRPAAAPSSAAAQPPPTLTLILACRNERKALAAIKLLRKEHELGLIGRRVKGLPERPGWSSGLRIVFEPLDVDAGPLHPSSPLSFCDRIVRTYPHITTLVLNAGMIPITGISYGKAFRQLSRDPVGTVTDPDFLEMEVGRKSADGKRGGVWGVNTLANYVLAKHLRPLLARSPRTLPLSPRIIYVSSKQADPVKVPSMFSASPPTSTKPRVELDLDGVDWQLTRTQESYDASKYFAELVLARLDGSPEFETPQLGLTRDGGGPSSSSSSYEQGEGNRRVRVLCADPGVVHTSFAAGVLPWWMVGLMVVVFYVARLAGSQDHTISANNGAASLSWLTLVDDAALEAAAHEPELDRHPSKLDEDAEERSTESTTLLPRQSCSAPTRYCSRSTMLGRSYTSKARTKGWDVYGGSFASRAEEECERVRVEWAKEREREGAGIGKRDGTGKDWPASE